MRLLSFDYGAWIFLSLFSPTLSVVPTVSKIKIVNATVGERQGIAQKGVRAIEARKSLTRTGKSAAKSSVHAPRLSVDQCEHPFV